MDRVPPVTGRPRTHRHHDSQWAAQFFAAAQLSVRGYLVSLTLGHALGTDLLAHSPGGVSFGVEVKGLSRLGGYWIVPAAPRHADGVCYIAVLNARSPAPSRFFVMTPAEVEAARAALAERRRGLGGFQVADVQAHEDRWEKLPS
jgi:hypothetical protein